MEGISQWFWFVALYISVILMVKLGDWIKKDTTRQVVFFIIILAVLFCTKTLLKLTN